MGVWRLLGLWLHAWLADLGPIRDAHNERIKLFAKSLNAVGLAALFGGFVSPIFSEEGLRSVLAALAGVAFWAAFSFAAYRVLGYTQIKD